MARRVGLGTGVTGSASASVTHASAEPERSANGYADHVEASRTGHLAA